MKKEKERIICAIPKEDIYHNTVNTDEKSPAGQGESDLQAELSEKAAAQPEAEDCSIDIIPDVTKPGAVPTGSWEKSEGTIKSTCGRLLVPDVVSMTKYLCSNHRLIMPIPRSSSARLTWSQRKRSRVQSSPFLIKTAKRSQAGPPEKNPI